MSHYYRQKRDRSPETPASPRYARRHDERQPLYSGNPTQKHTQGHDRAVHRLDRLDEDALGADIDGNGGEGQPPVAPKGYRCVVAPPGSIMRTGVSTHPAQTSADH